MPLIECVPNFSEGRDAGVVNALVEVMLAVPGVTLLDREMDADHHRSVITIAGEPRAVAEAAVRGAGLAAERIDLRRHQGAHPRIGATDVIPFVPLEGVTLAECVVLAEWAGAELWRRFQIPVYLYEAAARRPERRGLENIRKGQFEGLREEVRSNPDRCPDFGDSALHPSAGATVVGARKFLIAYNVNLDTADLEIAKTIAKTIRTSSGGLPALKGMGVMLSDPPRAQVSMNLTDFETTSLATAWRVVNQEAAKHGVHAVESELIGLAPRAALESAAAELLRFASFDSGRVVENRVAQVMAGQPAKLGASLTNFLDALASDAPAPGGGSAAAASGAMAAALGEMLSRLAQARAARKGVEEAEEAAQTWAPAGVEFARLRQELTRAVDEDSEAYLAIRSAMKLPKATAAEQAARSTAINAATELAADVPLGVAVRCRRIEEMFRHLRPHVPPAMLSDCTSAHALAGAGRSGACDNIAINLAGLPEGSAARQRLQREWERLQRP